MDQLVATISSFATSFDCGGDESESISNSNNNPATTEVEEECVHRI